MTEAEKYLFDVHGYLVIEGALSAEEVTTANEAIDHYADKISIRDNDLANESTTLKGKMGRGDLGGMLTWEKPYCNVFREMIAHPNFMPHLEELLGPGFRLEAQSIITIKVMGTYTPPPFFDELTEVQQAVISAPHYRREDKGSRLYRYRENLKSRQNIS